MVVLGRKGGGMVGGKRSRGCIVVVTRAGRETRRRGQRAKEQEIES